MNWQVKKKLFLNLTTSIKANFIITFATKILSFLMKMKEQEKKNSTILCCTQREPDLRPKIADILK